MSDDIDDDKVANREKSQPVRAEPLVKRGEGGRFLKGSIANPGGRPKGLAERIRTRTNDGQLLIDALFDTLKDKKAKRSEIHEAVKILLERGYGKAIETSVIANIGGSEGRRVLEEVATEHLLEFVNGARQLPTLQRVEEPKPLPSPEPENPLDVLQHGEKVGDGEKDPA